MSKFNHYSAVNQAIVERLTRAPERRCKCSYRLNNETGSKCGAECTPTNGARGFSTRRTGGRVEYFCPEHSRMILESYFAENRIWAGTSGNGRGFTFSQELETSSADYIAFAELNINGYLPSADSTVYIEFKSPIHRGLNGLTKYARSIESMMQDEHLSIDNSCGTHFHVGRPMSEEVTRELCIDREKTQFFTTATRIEYWKAVTSPLEEYLTANPETTEIFWGRRLGGTWAHRIAANPYEHANFINLQHSDTIEWRLPRFKTAAQYSAVMEFCRDATETFINEFSRYIPEYLDTSNIPSAKMREYAVKAGREILRLYFRALNKAGIIEEEGEEA